MVNITNKVTTLRKAIAKAVVRVSKQETIDAIVHHAVPKGDVFEFSRAAGLLAVKKTSDVIPDCHPLPVEYTAIRHAIDGLDIVISVEVHTIYRTGVEVEAMHGASVVALTMYDMLKPIDKGIEILNIRLDEKSGGKTDFGDTATSLRSALIICSDSIAAGTKPDMAGPVVMGKLVKSGIVLDECVAIADDVSVIQRKAQELAAQSFNLAIFCGGTGLYPGDVTPEAIAPLIDKSIPGVMEAARAYGQERTPYAMLARGVAGFIGNMLVLTLPGSSRGASETVDALFPYILHVFKVAEGLGARSD